MRRTEPIKVNNITNRSNSVIKKTNCIKWYRFYSLLSIALLLLASCEYNPSLETPSYYQKLVVDGWIEQGDFPTVILSYSSNYFSNIDSASIRKLMVTTAKVTVSDGTQQEILTLKRNEGFFPPYFYQGTSLKGEIGKNYTLSIELNGEKYTTTTSIPQKVNFNKIWFELAPGQDSLGYLYGEFTDDGEKENYYRLFTQRLSKDKNFVPVYLSAVGDQYFNGKTFTFSILRGPENYSEVMDDLYFKKGDTVKVKFCTMDRAHFDFWRTVERELYVLGNPFSSSGNEIKSNIGSKNVLGVWGGYGATYYNIIVK